MHVYIVVDQQVSRPMNIHSVLLQNNLTSVVLETQFFCANLSDITTVVLS